MSDPQRNSSAPDFQPLGTTASLRMLGSVMGRLQGGSSARGAQPSHHSGSEMTVAGGEHATGDEKSSASARGSQQPQVMLDAGWSPSLSRTAMQLQEQREASGPLWSTLPKADLKPVVSAVEADLGAYLAAERQSGRVTGLPVVAGGAADEQLGRGGPGGSSSSQIQRAAVDASTRLLDAVRAQASAQAIASDNRISLGDLTLIAFADSKKQMAAASSHVEHTPDTHPLKKAIDNSANKKMMEDRKGFETKLKKVAELALESLEKSMRISKERFG